MCPIPLLNGTRANFSSSMRPWVQWGTKIIFQKFRSLKKYLKTVTLPHITVPPNGHSPIAFHSQFILQLGLSSDPNLAAIKAFSDRHRLSTVHYPAHNLRPITQETSCLARFDAAYRNFNLQKKINALLISYLSPSISNPGGKRDFMFGNNLHICRLVFIRTAMANRIEGYPCGYWHRWKKSEKKTTTYTKFSPGTFYPKSDMRLLLLSKRMRRFRW